jgi:ubiquinone/menaquinone biosynthesis C-methylase UbiE
MNLHPDLSESLKKRQKIDRYSMWMYNSFKKYIGKRVLDIGSGTGNIIKYYIDTCELVLATDIFQHQVDYVKQRFTNNKVESYLFDIANDDIAKFSEENIDTITCINVLEHIEKDYDALIKMKSVVNEQGKIIILVPAFSKLYGTMDKACGHYRRYDRKQLQKLAEKADLRIIENRYFNFLGVIPWYYKGRILKSQKTFSDGLNDSNSKIYNAAVKFLQPIENILKPAFGISEIIVLEKYY